VGEQDRPAIAVVDDDASLRRSVCNLLRSRGFPTEAFPSAEEFLSSPRREIVGCLVLDLRMSGMSGLDLLRHLRAAEVQIPVVILTAQGDEGTRQRCLEAGAAAFLVKPFRAEMLLAEIRAALN
jgi:FixJ family two-component response regulator